MNKGKRGGCLKTVLIVFGVIFVIGIIGSIGGGGNKKDKTINTPSSTVADSSGQSKAEDVKPDAPKEYQSALKKANSYSDVMHMSKAGIYDQLVSEYGEKFSAEAAQYAIDNINADWNLNALEKAKSYQETMDMSPEAIRDQLTSENGEKFTAEEAEYAIANLN